MSRLNQTYGMYQKQIMTFLPHQVLT
uniref:Uncharacterized protein n=1 Tax=Arundo donax TaxID=35708 RepID=A0A0A8YXB9_ARUDO